MPRNDITRLTASQLVERVHAGELSPVDLVSRYLERIDRLEPSIHALTFVNQEGAIAEAERLERECKGKAMVGKPLLGLPLIVKDCISTAGMPTTCGSKILQGYLPPYDATVVTRLKAAGAIIIAKSNMDEFAMGSSTESSAHGPTFNPWDVKRVPGGSSGGSGAAIAAREAPLSLGSDTGGSIRCPASYCGVTGIKPTYGRVSRFGLVAYANSLEQIGPICVTARDCAMMLQVMAGRDPRDSTTVDVPVDAGASPPPASLDGLTVGIPREFFTSGLNPGVRKVIEGAIDEMCKLGAKTVEVSLPSLKHALPTYYLIAMCEASSNLARFDGLRYGLREDAKGNYDATFSKTRQAGFGPEVRRRIILGTYALSAGYFDMYYMKALQVRTLIQQDFKKALEQADILAGPTMPSTAFEIGTKMDDPLTMYLEDILTVPVNLAGIPSISMPAGFDAAGMPVGLQLMGNHFHEARILGVAMALEERIGAWQKLPPAGG